MGPSNEALKHLLPFELQHTLSLHSILDFVKQLDANEKIGYEGEYVIRESQWIGTVPIEYVDRWHQQFKMSHVLVDERRVPIVGRISMDQLVIALPQKYSVRTRVTFFGRQGNETIVEDEIAQKANQPRSEVFSSLSNHVPRGLFLIVFLPAYCCYQCCAGKPWRSNVKFVNKTMTNDEEKQIIDIQLFQSGYWKSQYFQYNTWHGPHQIELSFDALQSKVTGSGLDDIGMYSIEGIYSTQTRRMGLTKKYQLGTGNPLENLGHCVTIQLEWNKYSNQFEGKWYVRTKKYKDSGDFKMNFDQRNQQLSFVPIYEKV
ncbi:unnamed protein product [Rotaria sp. Silwood1]|nr:unnamed protein product [Rotaria sp. Silwood1]